MFVLLALKVTKGGNGAFTVRGKDIWCVSAPAVPVTVTLYVPIGVEAVVLIVSVVKHAGLHWVGKKDVVTPTGDPVMDTENKVD